MIHVCYELNDKSGHYSKFVGVSMLSMFENTKSEITVHILHDSTLSQDNLNKFKKLAENYNQSIVFYNVEKMYPEKILEYKSYFSENIFKRFSSAGIMRLMIQKVIPENIGKLIHIDADTVINMDINELYKIDLQGKILAAVPELECNYHDEEKLLQVEKLCEDYTVKPENYFNAGIMLMDLKYFREMKESYWEEVIKFITGSPKYNRLLNQNIFNYCFSEKYLKLSRKFNCWVREQRSKNIYEIEKNIYHYIGHVLELNTKDIYNRLFFEYFTKTSWFNEKVFENIYIGLNKMHDEQQKFMIKVTKILAGKERAFFTEYVSVKHVKKTFLITDEEIIATEENENLQDEIDAFFDTDEIAGALKNLSDSMKKSHGKKVYFLLVSGYYPKLCEILQSQGFIENEDFINGNLFRSESSGEPIDTYGIVKMM